MLSMMDSVSTLHTIPPEDMRWHDIFQKFSRYVKERGHVYILAHYRDSDGFPLGDWVRLQRTFNNEGRLTEDQQQLFDALPGWTWDARENAWLMAYQHLLEFVRDTGSADVLLNYTSPDGFQLGTWVKNQKKAYRRGSLSGDKVDRLTSHAGWSWD